MIKTILLIILIIICAVLSVIILMQEGNENGLGAISGSYANTYWAKNKNRSMKGRLRLMTGVLGGVALALIIVINLPIWS